MYTVIETQAFIRTSEKVWSDAERVEFIVWLASNPLAGDVIPGTGGLRKVRWSRKGIGKRGGARAIYYNLLDIGEIWLIVAYAKADLENMPTHILNQLREAIDDGDH